MHSCKTVQNHGVIFRLQITFSPVTLNALLMRCQFPSLWNYWQNPCDLWGHRWGALSSFFLCQSIVFPREFGNEKGKGSPKCTTIMWNLMRQVIPLRQLSKTLIDFDDTCLIVYCVALNITYNVAS